jgi:hemerythrin
MMPLITWSDALSVGIKEIDGQHQCLIELVNRLHDSMKEGKRNSVLGSVLVDLIQYTTFHFPTEENYFKQYGYPEYLRHKIEHDELTRKAKELNEGFLAGKVSITIHVMNFLKDWLRNHILASDKKYSPLLCSKGLNGIPADIKTRSWSAFAASARPNSVRMNPCPLTGVDLWRR